MKVGPLQRKSHKRDVIESELKKLNSHPTAAELYEIIRGILPKISLGTVYRNLEQLAENKLIKKLTYGTSVRFDGNPDYHYHIRCIYCDNVADIHDLREGTLIDDYETLAGYKVIGYNIEFTGICPECLDESKHDS